MQLRGLFKILLNFKISFNIKNYKIKKILLKDFISIKALTNFITIIFSLTLLPINFKPFLQQLANNSYK